MLYTGFLLYKTKPRYNKIINVVYEVLGGQPPVPGLKIWADPPPWKSFEQVTP